MVRKLMALFALVITFGMAASPIAAQDVSQSDLEALGIESGYVRGYISDDMTQGAAMKMVGGFVFDEEETVQESFETFACGFAAGFSGEDALDCDALAETGNVTVADVDGIGDKAIEFTGEAQGMEYVMLMVADENYMFLVVVLGEGLEEGAADDIAKYLVDAEPVDTEVAFNEDGTSTGGIYDMLPQEGDAEIEGFTPQMDMDLIGSTVATPAS